MSKKTIMGQDVMGQASTNLHCFLFAFSSGMLGGVARMTISLAVILMETTQNVQFLLPIMMILLVSKWVGDLFNISLYDLHVEIQCMPFVEASPPLGMENMVAVQVASGVIRSNMGGNQDSEGGIAGVSHVRTVSRQMTVKQLLHLLTTTCHGGYPVILGKDKDYRMVGFLLRNRLVTLLNAVITKASTNNDLLGLTEADFGVTLNSKRTKLVSCATNPLDRINSNTVGTVHGEESVVDLSPYIDRSTLSVQVGFPMSKVYTLFRSLGLRHLCVVNENGAPVGILTRKELMCAFDRDLM